jgi:hypothetical protein
VPEIHSACVRWDEYETKLGTETKKGDMVRCRSLVRDIYFECLLFVRLSFVTKDDLCDTSDAFSGKTSFLDQPSP